MEAPSAKQSTRRLRSWRSTFEVASSRQPCDSLSGRADRPLFPAQGVSQAPKQAGSLRHGRCGRLWVCPTPAPGAAADKVSRAAGRLPGAAEVEGVAPAVCTRAASAGGDGLDDRLPWANPCPSRRELKRIKMV